MSRQVSNTSRLVFSSGGWSARPLGEVCAIFSGGTPSKSNSEFWQGTIPWVSPKDMHVPLIQDTSDHVSEQAVRASAARVVPPPAVLVVVRSGILARRFPVALCDRPVSFNQDIKAIVPKAGVLDPEFLVAVLCHHEKRVLEFGVKFGATVHSMKSGFLEELSIPLPPLPEQKRIAGILKDQMSAVERARAAAEQQLEAINALPDALLRKAFSGEL